MLNRKLGALLGAFVGDAAGATLEFCNKEITREIAVNATKMPGGGVFKLKPGQITDDSELAISLGMAILENKDPNNLLDEVASKYVDWYETHPFDIGNTCARAFSIGKNYRDKNQGKIKGLAEAMKSGASSTSEANGALMRSTPIAALLPETLNAESFAMEDAALSHPHKVCQQCNAIYTVTIKLLIDGKGDHEAAYNAAIEYAKEIKAEVPLKWLRENLQDIDCKSSIGHVRHGFVLAFYFLRNKISYEESIIQTLMKGGDTDTNACIVGGMMGALFGAKAIPDHMKEPVLKSQPRFSVSDFIKRI